MDEFHESPSWVYRMPETCVQTCACLSNFRFKNAHMPQTQLETDRCKAPLDEDSLAPLDEDKTRPLGRHDRSNGRHFIGTAIQGDARYA